MLLSRVITKVNSCKRAVNKILTSEEPVTVISLSFKINRLTGNIALLTLHHGLDTEPIIFDTQTNNKLWIEGEICRLLQADRVIKVIHDCRTICHHLKEKLNITTNTVFDTQVAYSLDMETKKMPPRLIDYASLYRNVTEADIEYESSVAREEVMDKNMWSKRPLPDNMNYNLTREVTSLRLEIYTSMLPSIPEDLINEFEKRCHYATRGQRLTSDKRPYVYTPNTHVRKKSQIRVHESQKPLLPNTRALTSE